MAEQLDASQPDVQAWAAKLRDAIFGRDMDDIQEAATALASLSAPALDEIMPFAAMFFAPAAVAMAKSGGSPTAGAPDAISSLLVENEGPSALKLLAIARARALDKNEDGSNGERYSDKLANWTALAFARETQGSDLSAFLAECLADPALDWKRGVSAGGLGAYAARFNFEEGATLAQVAASHGGPKGAAASLASGTDVAAPALASALALGSPEDFIDVVKRVGVERARDMIQTADLRTAAREGGSEWLLDRELLGAAPMTRTQAQAAVDQCGSLPELFALGSMALGSLRMAWGDAPAPSLALAEAWGTMSHIAAVAGPTLRLGYKAGSDEISAEEAIAGALASAKAALRALMSPTGDKTRTRLIAQRAARDGVAAFFAGVEAPSTPRETREAIAGGSAQVALRKKASWAEVARAAGSSHSSDEEKADSLSKALAAASAALGRRGFAALRVSAPIGKTLSAQIGESMALFEMAFSRLPMKESAQGLGCIQWTSGFSSLFRQGCMAVGGPVMAASAPDIALHEYGHAVDFWCKANMDPHANPMSEHKKMLASSPAPGPLADFSELARAKARHGRRVPSAFMRQAAELDAASMSNNLFLDPDYYRQPTEMAARSFELLGGVRGALWGNDDSRLPLGSEADAALASVRQLLAAVEARHVGQAPAPIPEKLRFRRLMAAASEKAAIPCVSSSLS